MGRFLDQILTKFGVGPDVRDSVALTQALGDTLSRINKNREAYAAIEASIPGAVIASSDGAATERRELADLRSEHEALLTTEASIRREIAEALNREQAAQREKELAVAEADARELEAIGEEGAAIIGTMADWHKRLLAASAKFSQSVSVIDPSYSSNQNPSRFPANLARTIELNLFIASDGAITPQSGITESPFQLAKDPRGTILGAIREHVAVALGRRRQAEQTVNPPDTDLPIKGAALAAQPVAANGE